MRIHHYLTLFPVEALIASHLEPCRFGSYMATGSKKGSYEIIMFIEIDGGFGDFFDWEYGREKCVPHQNGEPKNSLYLSVYRTLEHVPLTALRSLFLTTRDGRSLELPGKAAAERAEKRGFWVYQEICPIRPLAVSVLDPPDFARYMCDRVNKTWVPKIVFADLKVANLSPEDPSGEGTDAYDRNLEHLKDCIASVTELKAKPNKIVDRSSVDRFSYQLIGGGVYVGDGKELVAYAMKGSDELRRNHYEWGRSAMIL